jgi:phosphoglycerate dehydrogenase-like enzyme
MPLTLLVIANPSGPHGKLLEQLPNDIEFSLSNEPDRIRAQAPHADAILNTEFRGALLGTALSVSTTVRWVHHLYTGVEGVLIPEVVASTVPLTNGRGVFRRPLGEWAIGAMLHFAYDLRRVVRQQEAGVWQTFFARCLHGSTLGIVGYGGIGSTAAALAKPFGVKIAALRRRPELFANDPLVDTFYRPAQLNELMAASDYLLLATPLTSETRGMIGAEQIAAMKLNGVVINVGRGPVIDEPALVAALDAGKIKGAALDVFEVEPLPAGHPFWGMQNVLLSPHTADRVENFFELAYEAFFENLDRFRKGERLEYLVDKHAGY